MVDLNQVSLFATVVDAGSFSGAARALGVPKATVSRKVASLEAALGARLLHRTTRKLELTAVGQRYYAEAREGLARLDAAARQLSTTQAVPRGTLRVAAPVDFAAHRLMDGVPEFLQRYPEVDLELLLSDDFADLLAERIDVAFRTGRLPDSSFVARRLGPARRVLVASPAYLARRGTPRRPADLREHDCVVLGATLANATWRLDGPRGRTEVRVRGRVAANAVRAALRAALAGVGIALLPSSLVQSAIDAGELRHVLARYGVEGGALHMVYPSRQHPSAALRAFVEFFEPRLRAR